MAFTKLLDKAKEAKGSIGQKFSDLKETFLDEDKQKLIQELKDKGHEKILQTVEDLDGSNGILHSAGYALNSFHVAVGMPPEITLSFDLLPHSDEIDQDAILAKTDNLLIKILLRSLLRARKVTHTFEWRNFTCTEVKVRLGLVPDVSLNFRKKEA